MLHGFNSLVDFLREVRSLRAVLDCSAFATLTYMATEIVKVCTHQTVGERRDAENGLTSPGLTRN